MSLSKVTHVIELLGSTDSFFLDPSVSCWQKKQGKLSVYVFAQIFSTGEELLNNYKLLRDHVAVCFQSQGDISDAERWNLYIFYFVSEKVAADIKQLVEQDKFSTRKIVCSNSGENISDQLIKQQINAELFEIEVPLRTATSSSLDAVIASGFPEVYRALTNLGAADTYEILTPLLGYLNHE